MKKIRSALISVFYKDNLEKIALLLKEQDVTIYSTGGTQLFLQNLGLKPISIESLTGYPSIFGGRLKTLHPKIFGGILYRREDEKDSSEAEQYEIPDIDLVIVDLYPFEETLSSSKSTEEDIIEKIDIGGVSLIRAAAKNHNDVLIVSDRNQYQELFELLQTKNGSTEIADRRKFASYAFATTSHYDTKIFNFFNQDGLPAFRESIKPAKKLRYGENPHQAGYFYGDLEGMFQQLNGKELSYNNLVDIDACVQLIDEFDTSLPTVAIIKHTNACGVATGNNLNETYLKALAADPVSAFGGVIITNQKINVETSQELNKLFFEVLIAPEYDKEALEILMNKKNRMLLKRNPVEVSKKMFKTLLNGVIEQDKDLHTEVIEELKTVTLKQPSEEEKNALLFAIKVCKHTKSNTIVLAKEGQLFASGVGQTSRVDALKQAIEKAKHFGFNLDGAVMASDAFFPFPDCVEIAHNVGITAVVQPGGSIKDQDSIQYCDQNEMAMVFTGIRHFKH